MGQEQFRFTSDAVGEAVQVQSFSGTEALSTPFQFHIDLLLPPFYAFESLLDQEACLHIMDGARTVHGIVFRAQTVAAERDEVTVEGHVLHRVLLVPPLLKLSLRRSVRIFQKMTTQEIVTEVLRKAGIQTEVEWQLKTSYTARDYCAQYRESDLDFISRLLEEEGITYYFEHDAEDLTMVCTDDASEFPPLSERKDECAIPYSDKHGLVKLGDMCWDLSFRKTLRSHQVTLRDYCFKNPELEIGACSSAEEPAGEIYDYPAEAVDTDLTERLARVRLEELQASKFSGLGYSNCARFVPGRVFELGAGPGRSYPREDLNQEYLIESVTHVGTAEGYSNSFVALPAKDGEGARMPYRPPRVTARPVVLGLHTAEVVGKAGEEIDVDEHGRVKVRFHWDRGDGDNPDSSCWIRVSQAWAGACWGSIFIPRIGQEVLVQFLEGDPDRPVIVGQVYNGTHPVPYDLPKSKTISTIKSSSSPGGNGYNELKFEDAAGSEEVFLHAQKNMKYEVENDWKTEVKNDVEETAKTITLKASDRIEIKVGDSVIVLTPDRIRITSSDIDTVAEKTNDIRGELVKLNC